MGGPGDSEIKKVRQALLPKAKTWASPRRLPEEGVPANKKG